MPPGRVLLGTIGPPHGVAGLLHVTSYTAPPEALAGYGPLEDEDGNRYRLEWAGERIARLFAIDGAAERPIADRDAAGRLANRRLYVPRAALPEVGGDEFYFADLIGLAAFDTSGTALGTVAAVHEYGAGASLEIGPLLIPFTRAAVPEINLAARRITIAPPAVLEAR